MGTASHGQNTESEGRLLRDKVGEATWGQMMQTLQCQVSKRASFPKSSGEPWERFEQGGDIVNCILKECSDGCAENRREGGRDWRC